MSAAAHALWGLPLLLALGACKTADVSVRGQPPVLIVSESTGAMPWLYAGLMGFFLLALIASTAAAFAASLKEKKTGTAVGGGVLLLLVVFLLFSVRDELTTPTVRLDTGQRRVECSWKALFLDRGRVSAAYEQVTAVYAPRGSKGQSGLSVHLGSGTRCEIEKDSIAKEQGATVREVFKREFGARAHM